MSVLGSPMELRCEYQVNPLGLDVLQPRLSWVVNDARRGAKQTGYQVMSADAVGKLKAEKDVCGSGKVESEQSTHVVYNGLPLKSRQRVYWKVRTWDVAGEASPWSEPAWFEMGLLERSEWQGEWIGSDLVGGLRTTSPCPFVRKVANLDKPIKNARLYVTALGLYEFHINGKAVGDDVFTPGWTDYKKRVQYQVYDVTGLLTTGANAVGAILGDGWYCGHVSWLDRQVYGDRPKLLAQLEVEYTDGSRQTIVTDGSWKTSPGPILEADMLMGESYDAKRELCGWDTPNFAESGWLPVQTFADPGIAMVCSPGPRVKRIMELKPVAPAQEPTGWGPRRRRYDLGQNMVGRVRITLSGPAGTNVTLRFSEMLNKDGSLYTTNLRSARATDHYTLKGGGTETWEPRFTFHGFRYVEVSSPRKDVEVHDLTGIVLHSDTPPTGDFECSDPLLNQLQHNIQWGQRGNFLEVPTDCPQRDERLGWTGDAQVFIRTACHNMDVAGFFTKWQTDFADAQGKTGKIPCIVPDPEWHEYEADGGPAWTDALVICPWTIYLCYGDKRLLEQHFERFEKFVEACGRSSKNYIREHPDLTGWGGFGDWLAIDGSGKTDGGTPKDLIGTAFYAYDAKLLSRMAGVLGKKDQEKQYEELFQKVRQAFQDRYVTKQGLVAGSTQTCYVLALHFDLVPAELRPALTKELVRDIEKRGNKLSTGFVGSPYLPHVLSSNGRLDVAYKLLFQKEWPSYLYAVTQGATTIWERWDGWTHDKGFQDAGMNSYNHYAYGAVGAWMYAVVAGLELDPEQPGYKHILIQPNPAKGLSHARANIKTMYGLAESGWKLYGENMTLNVTIPANTTATVFLPAADAGKVTENGQPASLAEGVKFLRSENGRAVFEVGAGRYAFESSLPSM